LSSKTPHRPGSVQGERPYSTVKINLSVISALIVAGDSSDILWRCKNDPDRYVHDILKGADRPCRAFRPDTVALEGGDHASIVRKPPHVPVVMHIAQPWQLTVTKGARPTASRRAGARDPAKGHPPAADLDWPTSYSGVYGDPAGLRVFSSMDAVCHRTRQTAQGRAAQMAAELCAI